MDECIQYTYRAWIGRAFAKYTKAGASSEEGKWEQRSGWKGKIKCIACKGVWQEAMMLTVHGWGRGWLHSAHFRFNKELHEIMLWELSWRVTVPCNCQDMENTEKENLLERRWRTREDGAPLLPVPSEPISLFPIPLSPSAPSTVSGVSLLGTKDTCTMFLSLVNHLQPPTSQQRYNSGSCHLLSHRPLWG